MLEIYVDDYISLDIPGCKTGLNHIANITMFPSNDDDDEDPISVKKLIKLDGQWDIEKELVECTFEGIKNSMVLEEKKMITIIVVLKEWLRSRRGVPFSEFHKAVAKVCCKQGTCSAGAIFRFQPAHLVSSQKGSRFHKSITHLQVLQK